MFPSDTTYDTRSRAHVGAAGKIYNDWAPRLLSVLRIITGFLFIAHGTQKLLGFPAGPEMRQPELMSLPGLAGVLELFGGALILIGWFTRPVAFVLSGLMAVAYFMAHAPQGFWPIINRGELAVLYCFVFLYLSAAGGGEWSLDRLFDRSRR
jgi:putative oxidoreductase